MSNKEKTIDENTHMSCFVIVKYKGEVILSSLNSTSREKYFKNTDFLNLMQDLLLDISFIEPNLFKEKYYEEFKKLKVKEIPDFILKNIDKSFKDDMEIICYKRRAIFGEEYTKDGIIYSLSPQGRIVKIYSPGDIFKIK